MARVKIFTGISPASWKVLKEAYPDKDLLNIKRDYPEKINRTFCTCGYTSGKLETECPICGNKASKTFTINGTGSKTLEEIRTFELEYMENESRSFEECVSGYKQETQVEITSTNEFEFIKTPNNKEFSICSDRVDSSTTRYNSYNYEDFIKLYPYKLDGLEYFNNSSRGESIQKIVKFINCKKDFPVLMNNIKKYPNIVNCIVSNEKADDSFKIITKFEEVYSLLNVPDPKLYPYIEKVFENIDSYGYRYYGTPTDCFNTYNGLSSKQKEVANYILIHGDCNIYDFKNICDSIDSTADTLSNELLFFVKNNYISYGNKIIKEFKSHCDYLSGLGYEINITNLDSRNFNIIKNKEHITEKKKYNEKKTMFFLENFDLNPLESLKYLDTRRAPNKDLLKELSDKLD